MVKVLYVVGLGRSGSTILSNSLGQIRGFFSAGELNFLWRHNVLENRLCGCGRPFHECATWQEIMRRAFGGPDEDFAREMIRLQRAGTRTRHIPLMLAPGGWRRMEGRIGKLLASYGRLYEAIGEVAGSRVVVDSSKEPAHGYAMSHAPGVELYALHLVRDPRAAAYSWQKKKRQPDTENREYMFSSPPARSAVMWNAWNAAAEALWRKTPDRYLRLRYEEFVADPRASFLSILKLVDEEDARIPLTGERGVELGVSHTVSGNPNRFETGTVELREDRRWQTEMSPRDRALVTALTAPLLSRYGYRP
ncbi:sulfotransferase [Rubrobacter naiadicus]|uniref:sulfotransferase n=1 Tax=Rubrobacter naiadicus TaxID=1392641 RepID=UPI0023609338|nr:sulfotransferase [Rubrobacter naiadicus]